ncbi:hypothetical protein BDN72DRAFT_878651, partial [Pluteus cervinus]
MDSQSTSIDCYARRQALQHELDSGSLIDGGSDFLRSTFKDVVPRRAITKFLTQSKSYDMQKKRWHTLPSNPSSDEKIAPKIHKILKEIFKHRPFTNEDRKLVCCDGHEVKYRNSDLCSHELDPDFIILGRGGRSFKERRFPSSPTYAQCVSLIRVTFSGNPRTLQSQITLAATYARQCFIEQHNRVRVYVVLLTETTMWLFQFDRGGATYSSSCNIHGDPHTFVRIVLGLASDEAQVGFDTSIFWDRGKRWISTRNQKGRRVDYLIQGDGPISQRDTLIGCATRCWRVIDPHSKKQYIIKEAWRLIKDDSEAVLLQSAKGLSGVGQLVAAEEDPTKTTTYFRGCRPFDYLPTDRAWCRMTLEEYGGSFDKFDDGLQLLQAYRDIILAIFDLWERGILHRDISINNVLFGKDATPPGSRGVLIDLDRAIRITVKDSLLGATPNIGTRAFQSASVLYSDTIRHDAQVWRNPDLQPYPHDYLDDMESLFYVLCWVCYQFDSPGIRRGLPHNLSRWMEDPGISANSKSLFLASPLPELPEYFQRGSAFPHLLEKLRQRFLTISEDKQKGTTTPVRGENLKDVCQDVGLEFGIFLGHVDKAIEEWNRNIRDPPKPPPLRPTGLPGFATPEEIARLEAGLNPFQTVGPIVGQSAAHTTKRAHTDLDVDGDDDAPSPKRHKTILTPTNAVPIQPLPP